jgi:hypothetical protein
MEGMNGFDSPTIHFAGVLNDLDLYITRNGASGRYYPNGLNREDTINNVERVRINNPADGATFIVNVAGSQLIENQDYSLVITGCIQDGTSVASAQITTQDVTPFQSNINTETISCSDGSKGFVVATGDTGGKHTDCTPKSGFCH